jgi:adenylyl-sulfate kinase
VKGCTIWIMGLSGAGKSTLARLLEARLTQLGYPAILLEPSTGTELRERLLGDLRFDREDKNATTLRLGYVAGLVTRAGGIAIVPWIAPERGARDQVRAEIGRFVEVYVQCPLEVCEDRDDRGLYAAAGTRAGIAGVTDPWEPPQTPEVIVDSAAQTPQDEVEIVLERLVELGYLAHAAKS